MIISHIGTKAVNDWNMDTWIHGRGRGDDDDDDEYE